MTSDRTSLRRRAFLASAAAGTAAFAGCADLRSRFADDGPTETGTPTDTGTGTPTDSPGGDGTPTDTPQGQQQGTPAAPANVGSYEPMEQDVASFENVDIWTTHRDVTMESVSGKDAYLDGPSGHVKGGSGTIERNFPVPIDLSDKDVSMAIRVQNPLPTNVRIWFTDTRGQQTRLIQQLNENHPTPENWVRFNPAINSVNADLSKVERMLVTVDGGGGKPVEYYLDDLRFAPKLADKAQVILTFDDITRDTYEVAYPILQEHGLSAVTAVPAQVIGNSGRLNQGELEELQEAGWEVASHSNDFSALHGLPADEQRQRVKYAKNVLQERGFGDVPAFMYPGGQCDLNTVKAVSEFHDLGFLAFTSVNKGTSQSNPMSPYFINRSSPSNFNEVRNQVRPVMRYNGLYTPYWHTVGPSPEDNISESDLREVVRWLSTKQDEGRLDVVMPSDLLSG